MTPGFLVHHRSRLHRTDQWQSLVGEIVQVWLNGTLYRKGQVDNAMPDASGLWIAQEGAFQREYIGAAMGFDVWTTANLPRRRESLVIRQPDPPVEPTAPKPSFPGWP